VSAAARKTGHWVSFGVTLTLMIVVNIFIYRGVALRKYKYQKRWDIYGPVILTAIAVPFIMADLTRHVLQDTGVWPESGMGIWSSAQYSSHIPTSEENLSHLSFIGWLFTIVFTYTGFILLAVGTMWNANITQKCGDIKAQWRELRGEGPVEAASSVSIVGDDKV